VSQTSPPPAPPQPTATTYIPPSETPTIAPVHGTGIITFGTAYDSTDLTIPSPKTSFKTTAKTIAWSASFSESAGATTITLILASVSSSGVEKIIDKEDVAVSNPDFDILASKADLASIVGRKAGTYVLRYLRDATILAQGQFKLVK
jgi:hypothetical protein